MYPNFAALMLSLSKAGAKVQQKIGTAKFFCKKVLIYAYNACICGIFVVILQRFL